MKMYEGLTADSRFGMKISYLSYVMCLEHQK